MLDDDIIMPNDSPFESPVVLCLNINGENLVAWRFSVDYHKLNAVT